MDGLDDAELLGELLGLELGDGELEGDEDGLLLAELDGDGLLLGELDTDVEGDDDAEPTVYVTYASKVPVAFVAVPNGVSVPPENTSAFVNFFPFAVVSLLTTTVLPAATSK